MRNLVVQIWGIGNLVQTEPLLRALGEGDILIASNRSTKQLAPLFPKWNFIEDEIKAGSFWDDAYICYPIDGRQFSRFVNRIHFPVWSFKEWKTSEARVLYEMAARWDYDILDFTAKLTMPQPVPKKERTIGLSIGYLKESGWSQKHWGNDTFAQAITYLLNRQYVPHLFGSSSDYDVDGHHIMEALPLELHSMVHTHFHLTLWQQIEVLAGLTGYLGNDTGLAHVAGALGLPTAVFTVTDRVKNRPAGVCFQFGKEKTPHEAANRLLELIDAQERA